MPEVPEPAPEVPEPAPQSPPVVVACGPAGLRLGDYGWVPPRTEVLASIDLAHPDLPASLDHLDAMARRTGEGLPLPLSFALGQWKWQLPWLRRTLHSAGFRPAELAYVRSEDGVHAWVWPARCDFESARRNVEAGWDVQLRRTLTAAIGSPSEGSSFAFDVVFLPGERFALTDRSGGGRFADFVAPPAQAAEAPSIRGLAQLDAAPIRLVVVPRGLVDPASAASFPMRRLSFDADGVREWPPLP